MRVYPSLYLYHNQYLYISLHLSISLVHHAPNVHIFPPLKVLPQPLLQLPPRLLINLLGALRRHNPHHPSLLLKVIHHRHARLHKRLESLLDTLRIIVRPPTRLPPLHQPSLHLLLRAVKKQHELRRAHTALEFERLVHLAGEAIDEEFARAGGGFAHDVCDGVFEEGDGHFHAHDVAVFDGVFDFLAESVNNCVSYINLALILCIVGAEYG